MASQPGLTHTPRVVALTGATGIVGRFVSAHFSNEGCQVRALARPASDRDGFAETPQWIEGNLQEPAALEELVQGADTLVHCALEHATGRYRGGEAADPHRFWQHNLLGTLDLLEAAARQGVQRVVLLSTRAVFGRRLTGPTPQYVDDDTPPNPDSHYGALKAATESLGQQYSASTSMTVTSIRPTGVYGVTWPERNSKWLHFALAALRGEPVEQVRTATEVHGEDLADAIWRMTTAPGPQINGRSFNCSDLTLSTREIARKLNELTGCTAPLPAPGEAPDNQMRCEGLASLGWRGGGEAKLDTTLQQLVQIARRTTYP